MAAAKKAILREFEKHKDKLDTLGVNYLVGKIKRSTYLRKKRDWDKEFRTLKRKYNKLIGDH